MLLFKEFAKNQQNIIFFLGHLIHYTPSYKFVGIKVVNQKLSKKIC